MPEPILGCTQDPFRLTPDPRFARLGRDARAAVRLAEAGREGAVVVLLCGAPGAGKSLLLKVLARRAPKLRPPTVAALVAGRPTLTVGDVVREALRGAPGAAPRCLLIDDADLLAPRELRRLLCLISSLGLRLVLSGAPGLEERVRALMSMEGCPLYCHRLSALGRAETAALIRHRMAAAGCSRRGVFPPAVVGRIAERSRGNPGAVVRLCAQALFHAAYDARPVVGLQDLGEAQADPPAAGPWLDGRRVAGVALALALGAVPQLLQRYDQVVPPGEAARVSGHVPLTVPAPPGVEVWDPKTPVAAGTSGAGPARAPGPAPGSPAEAPISGEPAYSVEKLSLRPGAGAARYAAPTPRAADAIDTGVARVFIHYTAGAASKMDVGALAAHLDRAGYRVAAPREVGFLISEGSVRYFSDTARATGRRLFDEARRYFSTREARGPARLMDFTHYRPGPEPGTLELWLPTPAPPEAAPAPG